MPDEGANLDYFTLHAGSRLRLSGISLQCPGLTPQSIRLLYLFGYCELLINKKFQVIRRLVTDDEPGQRGQDARSAR